MDFTQTQSTSTSIAWQYNSNVEVTPKGLIANRAIGTTSSTTSQYPHVINPTHAMFEGETNA